MQNLCVDCWAWKVTVWYSESLQGMPQDSLAALKHLGLALPLAPNDVASALGSLVSAAPNIATLVMRCLLDISSPEALVALQPLRRAAHLRTLWLVDAADELPTAARQAAMLEGVVRCLAQPGAEGGDEYCRALQHVLLAGAWPDAIAACRAALARDGICVSVDTCTIAW
jgi:hypothetical protein